MKKILAFSGSNSTASINQKLIRHAANGVSGADVTVISLIDFPMPLYGIDLETSAGMPENAERFNELIQSHDGFIVSVPEHNASFPAVFKNSIDWFSRFKTSYFDNKPILVMGTSPGRGGAKSSIEHATKVFSGFLSGNVVGQFSLPSFNHMTEAKGDELGAITDAEKSGELAAALAKLVEAL